VLKSLDVVLDIMSATCAMAVMFFIPALFLLKGMSHSAYATWWQLLAQAFIIVGGAVAVVSMSDVVRSLS